jgi:hypothetical protein
MKSHDPVGKAALKVARMKVLHKAGAQAQAYKLANVCCEYLRAADCHVERYGRAHKAPCSGLIAVQGGANDG